MNKITSIVLTVSCLLFATKAKSEPVYSYINYHWQNGQCRMVSLPSEYLESDNIYHEKNRSGIPFTVNMDLVETYIMADSIAAHLRLNRNRNAKPYIKTWRISSYARQR